MFLTCFSKEMEFFSGLIYYECQFGIRTGVQSLRFLSKWGYDDWFWSLLLLNSVNDSLIKFLRGEINFLQADIEFEI